jgi:hypothetical protein
MVTICPSCFNNQYLFILYFSVSYDSRCKTAIISLKSINQLIFVMVKSCFLCGTDWILKYHLDQLRLQTVNVKCVPISVCDMYTQSLQNFTFLAVVLVNAIKAIHPWRYSPSRAQAFSHIGGFLTFIVL